MISFPNESPGKPDIKSIDTSTSYPHFFVHLKDSKLLLHHALYGLALYFLVIKGMYTHRYAVKPYVYNQNEFIFLKGSRIHFNGQLCISLKIEGIHDRRNCILSCMINQYTSHFHFLQVFQLTNTFDSAPFLQSIQSRSL